MSTLTLVTVDSVVTDEALILRFREGDLDALGEFLDRYQSTALALAYRILGDRSVAEDVVQDALLSLWRRADSFQPERGNARTWLLSIVRNRAIDLLRSRSAQPLTVSFDPTYHAGSTPDLWHDVSHHLDSEEIRQGLVSLPAEQRQTVELAYFTGLTCVEIANRMAVPVGTVKGRLRLALKKLRQVLIGIEAEPAYRAG